MSCYTPTCAVPTCAPRYAPSRSSPVCYPVGGIGSLSSGGGATSSGGATTAASLGIVRGASVGCVSQMPSSELVVQPAPFRLTIPGPVISASCQPVRVGGYTACAAGSSSSRSSRSMAYGCRPYICRS